MKSQTNNKLCGSQCQHQTIMVKKSPKKFHSKSIWDATYAPSSKEIKIRTKTCHAQACWNWQYWPWYPVEQIHSNESTPSTHVAPSWHSPASQSSAKQRNLCLSFDCFIMLTHESQPHPINGPKNTYCGGGVPLKFTRGSCSDLAGKGYHVETSCSPPQEHRYTTYRSKCLQFLNKQQRQLFRWNEWLHYYEKQTSLTQGITIKEHESTEGRARG